MSDIIIYVWYNNMSDKKMSDIIICVWYNNIYNVCLI